MMQQKNGQPQPPFGSIIMTGKLSITGTVGTAQHDRYKQVVVMKIHDMDPL